MEIERLLKLGKQVETEKELIEMIISNRINWYLGDKEGAAISSKNFSKLADDILKWRDSRAL